MLVGLYLVFIIVVAFVKPSWVPALPPEARIYNEANGSSGHRSLLVLMLLAGGCAWAWSSVHESIINPWVGRDGPAANDEVFILSTTIGAFVALGFALINKFTRAGLLSRLTERVTFVLISPHLVHGLAQTSHGELHQAVHLRDVHSDRLDRLQFHLQRRRWPHLGGAPV
jgi:TRAP-type mannitol/chloroaromatic compound transport system permease large subunit